MKLALVATLLVRMVQVTLLLAAVCTAVRAQEAQSTPLPVAPPPLRVISREERSQISDVKDAKGRIKLTLELAGAHLTKTEIETSRNNYDTAAAEAGKYWALVEDVFVFLRTIKENNNKTRDLYKRVELALRADGPRLIAVRRNTPAEYAVWIKELEEFARHGRTEALNSFYGNTVVRDPLDQKQAGKPKNSITPE
jgi:hypothetical protein